MRPRANRSRPHARRSTCSARPLASLAAQIRSARIQIETAQANLGYARIVAPIDNEVVAVVTQEGQTVIAQQQAPVILKLADLDTMTVKAQVSEADVIRVRAGQTAYFTILGEPDKRHYGKLRAIEPAPQNYAEAQPRSAAVPAAARSRIRPCSTTRCSKCRTPSIGCASR